MMEYVLWNALDNVTATPDTYPDIESAADAKGDFVDGFRRQGYYLTARHERVPVNMLAQYIEVRAVPSEGGEDE
jgi:hypothetical protein